MSVLQTNIESWLNQTKVALIRNYIATKRKASGRWARELENFYHQEDRRIVFGIKGNDYTYYLINGRRPTKTKTAGNPKLIDIIKQWIKDKGLILNPYAVTNKIHKDGIKVPNKYNKGDILSNVLTDSYIKSSIDIVREYFGQEIKSQTINIFE